MATDTTTLNPGDEIRYLSWTLKVLSVFDGEMTVQTLSGSRVNDRPWVLTVERYLKSKERSHDHDHA